MKSVDSTTDQRGSLRPYLNPYHLVRTTSPPAGNEPNVENRQASISPQTTQYSAAYRQTNLSDQRTPAGVTKPPCSDKETSSTAPSSPGNGSGTLLYTWRWELAIWLLGTAGLIANVVLLICFNGVEQRVWKSGVQITAFVAALAQLSQSALLVPTGSSLGQLKWRWLQTDRKAIDTDRFDLASRGPDGCLRLLWHLKMRPHLATVGALSTLLLLAFPTFIQQSVAINTRQIKVLDDGESYLWRTEYAHRALRSFQSESHDIMNRGFPDSFAMIQGLFSSYVNPANVTGSCATGMCTWERYTTLSICATTEDVTDRLIEGRILSNGTRLPPSIGEQTLGPADTSNLPPTRDNTTFYTYVERLEDTGGWDFRRNNTDVALPDFARVYVIYYDPFKDLDAGSEEYDSVLNVRYWLAVKANLHACIQTMNVTYDRFWQANIVDSRSDVNWRYVIKGGDELSYCSLVHALDDFCLSHYMMYQVGGSVNAAYNVSVEYRNVLFGIKRETDSKLNPSRWMEVLRADFRNDDAGCKRNSTEEFKIRIERIAARFGSEMQNTDSNKVRNNRTA